jgi:hypothetical protein
MEYYKTHDDNEYTLLGEIELFDDYYYSEYVLGDVNMKRKVKSVTVELYTSEGWEKPHLHLYNDHFKCAIRLDVNQYFIHGKYQDKLNDNQAKLFDDFMRTKDDAITTWMLAKELFNRQFRDHKITVKEQPDYTKLNYTTNLKDEANTRRKNGKA